MCQATGAKPVSPTISWQLFLFERVNRIIMHHVNLKTTQTQTGKTIGNARSIGVGLSTAKELLEICLFLHFPGRGNLLA